MVVFEIFFGEKWWSWNFWFKWKVGVSFWC